MTKLLIVSALMFTFLSFANAQIDSSLSSEDIKYLDYFKSHGFIPEGMNEDNVPVEELKGLIEFFKIESGIDDIESIEKPDDRLSSPERTWELYRSSFLAGDIELANKCLMPKYREKHDSMRKAMGDDKMKHMIEEMKPIEKVFEEDGSAKYRIKRKIGNQDITFYIYFVKVVGNWRILEY